MPGETKFTAPKSIVDGTDVLARPRSNQQQLPPLPASATKLPFWEDADESFDQIRIGTHLFEKTPVIVGGDLAFKLDSKPAPGTDGARQTPQGYIPANVTITWHVYTVDHWTELQALIAEIKPKPGKTVQDPDGIAIAHPILELYGLLRFRIPKIPFVKALRGGADGFEATIHCVEWFASPKATGATVFKENPHPSIFDGQNKPQVIKPSATSAGKATSPDTKFVRGKRLSG